MAKARNTDEYIAQSAAFAQAILTEIRDIVHEACPKCEEKIKWLFPHFDYKGGLVSMAAFKKHCAFTFWKGKIMDDPDQILQQVGRTAMGQLGKIKSLEDLPPRPIMIKYIHEAMRLNDENIALPKKKKTAKTLKEPDYFMEALGTNEKANQTYSSFSPSNKKDYVEWIVEAKTEATRQKRLATAIEWMSEGKPRNWKYMKKYK